MVSLFFGQPFSKMIPKCEGHCHKTLFSFANSIEILGWGCSPPTTNYTNRTLTLSKSSSNRKSPPTRNPDRILKLDFSSNSKFFNSFHDSTIDWVPSPERFGQVTWQNFDTGAGWARVNQNEPKWAGRPRERNSPRNPLTPPSDAINSKEAGGKIIIG